MVGVDSKRIELCYREFSSDIGKAKQYIKLLLILLIFFPLQLF
jgi:hypothetical protein